MSFLAATTHISLLFFHSQQPQNCGFIRSARVIDESIDREFEEGKRERRSRTTSLCCKWNIWLRLELYDGIHTDLLLLLFVIELTHLVWLPFCIRRRRKFSFFCSSNNVREKTWISLSLWVTGVKILTYFYFLFSFCRHHHHQSDNKHTKGLLFFSLTNDRCSKHLEFIKYFLFGLILRIFV